MTVTGELDEVAPSDEMTALSAGDVPGVAGGSHHRDGDLDDPAGAAGQPRDGPGGGGAAAPGRTMVTAQTSVYDDRERLVAQTTQVQTVR
jgi:hypothetical protein